MLGVALYNMELNSVVKEGAVVALEGLAGGTFIYVTCKSLVSCGKLN